MAQESAVPAVDESALTQYRADGYAIVKHVFSPGEMAALSEEANRLFALGDLIDVDNLRCRWQNHVETSECRFDCFDPIIDLSDAFERAARDERLFDIVASLYGEPACLFKDKLIYKPPGATGYGLHQDYISWPSFPRSFVTLLMPIDPANDDNGDSRFFPERIGMDICRPLTANYHEVLPPLAGRRKQGRAVVPRARRRGPISRDAAASLSIQQLADMAPAVVPEL